jgi:CheY-specific phosphatase CheX
MADTPMTDTSIHRALRESVVEVLDKMFFVEAITDLSSEAATQSPAVLVSLRFDGDPPGVFRMSLDRAAAALIAADFLGEDPESLTGPQVEEVAKELANMICGAVLSRIESSVTFRLSAPDLVALDEASAGAMPGTTCSVETGSGRLIAGIDLETRTCSLNARSAS